MQRIACLLVRHGANLEYCDIALRNTLFWVGGHMMELLLLLLLLLQVVYNNNRDLAYFILQCGARVRPWSWLQAQHLPEPLRQDRLLVTSHLQCVLNNVNFDIINESMIPGEHDHQRLQPAPEAGALGRGECEVGPRVRWGHVSRVTCACCRHVLSRCVGGRSILARIDRLPCQPELRNIIRCESALYCFVILQSGPCIYLDNLVLSPCTF